MRITRPFVLLALAALLAPRIEASRTSVWESNPPASLTATRADATGLLAALAPVARLAPAAADDAETTETPLFNLGDVVLVDTAGADAEHFDLGPLTLVDLNLLRGPPSSYPETRVGGFELLPPFRIGASPRLSLWTRQACGFSCREVASDSRYDPWGLRRTTRNGGVNELGNLGDIVSGTDTLSLVAAGALDVLGNSVSEVLGLDTIADSIMVASDSDRSAGERAWAATKGGTAVALDVAGGAIVKKGLGLLGRIPGGSRLASAVKTSATGRFLRRDIGSFLPGGESPAAATERLLKVAREAHAANTQGPQSFWRSTTGALETESSTWVGSGAQRNLSKKAAATLAPDTKVARLTNRRIEILNESLPQSLPARADAEVTLVYRGVIEAGERPLGLAVFPNEICAKQCTGFLRAMGAEQLSPHSAWWFSPVDFTRYLPPLGGLVQATEGTPNSDR